MQLFLHYKTQQIEGYIAKLSELNNLFKRKSFQFEKEFYLFIDQLIEYFKQIGDHDNQTESEMIRNIIQTAEEGIDPIRLERVEKFRRTMKRKTTFHSLSRVTEMLQRELRKEKEILALANTILGQLVISLIQSGHITNHELSMDLDQSQLQIIWHRLSQNEEVKLHERNLKLTVTQEDIFVLFAEIMNRLKNL